MIGQSLLQNVIAATGSVVIFLGLRTFVEPLANKYPILFLSLGFILFLYAGPISRKVMGNN